MLWFLQLLVIFDLKPKFKQIRSLHVHVVTAAYLMVISWVSSI